VVVLETDNRILLLARHSLYQYDRA